MKPSISFERVSKQYGKRKAVCEVNFTIMEGQISVFLGPNGAGKSTTMNMLATLLRPTSGKITVEESEVRSVSAAPISFEANTHGSPWNIWDDYGEPIGTWFHYDWADYLEYTVEMKSGDTFVYSADEIYEQFGVSVEYTDDQRSDNPWGVGIHSGTVELLGKSCTVGITVTEPTYTAVSVQFPAI